MDWLLTLEPELLAALAALGGTVVGAVATILGQVASAFITAHLTNRRQNQLDDPRKKLLKYLLEHRPPGTKWRSMKTLSRAIGATEQETARLLVTIGARGSLKEEPMWGLISVVGYPKHENANQDDD